MCFWLNDTLLTINSTPPLINFHSAACYVALSSGLPRYWVVISERKLARIRSQFHKKTMDTRFTVSCVTLRPIRKLNCNSIKQCVMINPSWRLTQRPNWSVHCVPRSLSGSPCWGILGNILMRGSSSARNAIMDTQGRIIWSSIWSSVEEASRLSREYEEGGLN